MNTAFVQTIWADVIACTLRDAGVPLCVISPGSRSTPLVAAFDRASGSGTTSGSIELVTLIDERAAAFYALGAARATGRPVALVCTSGSAAAHYLPALVEASHAGIPLIAITANRPPELHDCGASQTIDQRELYGSFARVAFELGAPVGEPLALRAVRRKVIQAITAACGPDPGPVHIDAAFKKPLEPAGPTDDLERGLAAAAHELLAHPPLIAPPVLQPDLRAIAELARCVASEPRGVIVAGALPGFIDPDSRAAARNCSRDALFELARRTGYPILAESGSQLRFGPRPDDIVVIDHFDLIATPPTPSVILQVGAEPVAAAWPAFSRGPTRWVLAGARWHDAESASEVVLGDLELALTSLAGMLGELDGDRTSSRRRIERASASLDWLADWRAAEATAVRCLAIALVKHPGNEIAAVSDALAALPANAILQVGNSLPIRVVDQVAPVSPDKDRRAPLHVITQRGAAGIDGLVASAAGATRSGQPTLLVLGDVSFAHDVGGLLATRAAIAPLAILVIDNAGGRIFDGLPIGNANLGDTFDRHWLTAPQLDITAVAHAVGVRSLTATSAAAISSAVASALATNAVTVIHAPVTANGARDVRATTLALALQPRTITPRTITIPREPTTASRIGGQP